jgi:hypothetical protein
MPSVMDIAPATSLTSAEGTAATEAAAAASAKLAAAANAVSAIAAVVGSPNAETRLALGKQAITVIGSALVSFGVLTPGAWSIAAVILGAALTAYGAYWHTIDDRITAYRVAAATAASAESTLLQVRHTNIATTLAAKKNLLATASNSPATAGDDVTIQKVSAPGAESVNYSAPSSPSAADAAGATLAPISTTPSDVTSAWVSAALYSTSRDVAIISEKDAEGGAVKGAPLSSGSDSRDISAALGGAAEIGRGGCRGVLMLVLLPIGGLLAGCAHYSHISTNNTEAIMEHPEFDEANNAAPELIESWLMLTASLEYEVGEAAPFGVVAPATTIGKSAPAPATK